MGPEDLVSAFRAVVALDATSSLTDVRAAAVQVAKARAWCDAADVQIAALIEGLSPEPEHEIARATRSSRRKAKRDMARKVTIDKVPAFGAALASGEVSGEHVDVVTEALGTRRRRDGGRARSALRMGWSTSRSGAHPRSSHAISGVSVSSSTTSRAPSGSSANAVTAGSARGSIPSPACTSSGVSSIRFRASSCRTGSVLRSRRGSRRRRPRARRPIRWRSNAFLARWHCIGLVERGAGGGEHARGSGRPEVTVVIDTRERDDAGGPVVDWGLPVELPIEVLLEMAQTGDVAAVVVRNGVVIHAPGVLDLGRTTRLANARPAAGAAWPVPAVRDPRLPGALRPLQDPSRGVVATRWPPPTSTTCCRSASGITKLIHHRGWVVDSRPTAR